MPMVTPPDSDAREVQRVPEHIPAPCIGWPTIRLLITDGQVLFDDVALVAADDLFRCDFVPVPLSLAQRILAELTTHHAVSDCSQCRVLRDELRAVVPK